MQVVSYRQMIRIHNQIDRSSSHHQSSFDSQSFTSIVQSRPVGRNPNPLVCTQGARPAHARDRWVPSVVFAQRPQGKQALLSLERCQAFTMNKEFHYVSSHGCTGFHRHRNHSEKLPEHQQKPCCADTDRRQSRVHGDQPEQRGERPGRWRTQLESPGRRLDSLA
ncbi:hypothetical protein D3C84_876580 [compost metagenome]